MSKHGGRLESQPAASCTAASKVPFKQRLTALRCIRSSTAKKSAEVSLPLSSSAQVPFWEPPSVLASQYKRDEATRVQWKAVEKIKNLEHLSYEERLKELRLDCLEKSRLGGSYHVCKHPEGECKEDRTRRKEALHTEQNRKKTQETARSALQAAHFPFV